MTDGTAAGADSILDAVDLPIVVVSRDCRVVRFNRAASMALNLHPSDVGRSVGEVLAGGADLAQLCAQVIADGAPLRREIRDQNQWFVARIAPVAGSDGQAGVVVTLTNVTALRAGLDQAIYEREFTKAILNTVRDPLVVLDADFRVQTANQAFYEMFRCSRDEARGIPLQTLGDSGWKEIGVWESLKVIHADGSELQSFEIECQFPGIGRRAVLLDARRLFGPSDSLLLISLRDITERKKAELNANLLASIVESSEDAIVGKDLSGTIMSWNRGAERLFGYTAAEAVGRPITIVIPPDRLDEEAAILERLKRGERIEQFDTIRVRNDGSCLNVSLTISPIKDAAGRIVGASKVARDFTEKMRQQKALQEANAALERANSDLEQFAYSASHDLQEPLRMVSIYSELLKQEFGEKLGERGAEFVGHTLQGALRMESLLKNLRIYTKMSVSDDEPHRDTDSGEILKQTLLTLEVAIRDSGASITYTELPCVRMHEVQLEQIFQNLIGNAIRYRGEQSPQIHIAANREGKNWVFSVQDNGIGIEPQFTEQIFGMFKRLHSATQYPGTGMGLAICKRIIERAGGTLWVESELGKGSTFYFTIPAEGAGIRESATGDTRGRSLGA
jgi:PAS domain S-box-containing protein